MNSLSWLIYLADVADALDWYLDVAWFIAFIVTACTLLAGAIMAGDDDADPSPEDWKTWRRILTGAVGVVAFSTVFGAIVPQKETLYAIAASEMGEEIVTSNTANKALNGINAWLDKQIEGEETPEAKEKKDGE